MVRTGTALQIGHSPMPSELPDTCRVCSKEFKLTRTWQKFCSKECRYYYHNHKNISERWKKNVKLTKNEKNILPLIMDKNLHTVYQMRDFTHIHRSLIYRVLNSLEYKGYIEKLPTQPNSWKYLGEP